MASYYLFPRYLLNGNQSWIHFLVTDCANNNYNQISPSLSKYLLEIREKINGTQKEELQKIINVYMWLHTPTPSKNKPVCKLNILSTSFFDYIEMIYTMHLNSLFDINIPLHSFHFARNNIGCIESLQKIRNHCKTDVYILLGGDEGSMSNNTNNIYSEQLREEEVVYYWERCYHNYGGTMDMITADSTVDFYSGKKGVISGMMQICLAIVMQKKKGIFIMKVEDSFNMAFLDSVCFLSFFYEKTFFIQPSTVDPTSSYKYIVCKGFLHDNIREFYTEIQQIWFITFSYVTNPKRLFSINIPALFIGKLEEINSIMGQPQLEQLSYAISTISNRNRQDRIHYLVKQNIQKCIEWCMKYHVLYQG